jgi:hypothetical protein
MFKMLIYSHTNLFFCIQMNLVIIILVVIEYYTGVGLINSGSQIKLEVL